VGEALIEGVIITPLKEIETSGGNVFHAMKCSEDGYAGFGEAYFSTIHYKSIKPWKRHLRMTLNLIVPIGRIRFVLHDARPTSCSRGKYCEIVLGRPDTYSRLTVPPLVWMAFEGLDETTSWLLNLANLEHDPAEVERRSLQDFEYTWATPE